MAVWKFSIQGSKVRYGNKKREKLTEDGCNEPYKNLTGAQNYSGFNVNPAHS